MIEAAEGIAAGFRLCGVYAKGKPCVRVGKHHAGYTQILIAISDAFTVFVKLRQQLVGVCADFLIYRISCIAAG